MRILLISNNKFIGEGPYIPELVKELENTSYEVTGLDDENLIIYEKGKEEPVKSFLTIFLHIPYVRRFVKRIIIHHVFKMFKELGRFDVCNIHYVKTEYSCYTKLLVACANRIVTTVWGSDFYGMDERQRKIQRKVYDISHSIIFGNPQTRIDFVSYYRAYQNVSSICNFGLASLTIIDKVRDSENHNLSRKQLGIKNDAFVICCGTNGYPMQNHESIIAGIIEAKQLLPINLVIILPMTYPKGGDRYKLKLRKILEVSKLQYLFFDDYLSKEDTARMRIVADIMIIMQNSDQLSAALQEHAYAGSIVLAGDWLPYQVFTDAGINLYRSSLKGIGHALGEIFYNLEYAKAKASEGMQYVYALSSWEHRLSTWKTIYEE